MCPTSLIKSLTAGTEASEYYTFPLAPFPKPFPLRLRPSALSTVCGGRETSLVSLACLAGEALGSEAGVEMVAKPTGDSTGMTIQEQNSEKKI